MCVPVFYEQPVLVTAFHPDQCPGSLEFLSSKDYGQLAPGQTFSHLLFGPGSVIEKKFLVFIWGISSPIPDNYLPSAVLSLGNYTFKTGILQRVILHHYRQAFNIRV